MVKVRNFKKCERSNQDRISSLPDDLLLRILSDLSTKDVIRTSRLSKRWRKVWSSVPALDLDFRNFKDEYDLFEFIDKFLESSEVENLKSFKLLYDADEHDQEEFESRMDGVIKRRVCSLTILNRVALEEALVTMPLSLYSCGSLVNLTVYGVVFEDPKRKSVSLPCLKTLHLEAVKFDGVLILKRLISRCLILEELTIVTHPDDFMGVVSVRSQSLKSFKLESMRDKSGDYGVDPKVEIDSPRLDYLSVTGYRPESFIIHSISPSAKVNIDGMFSVDDPLKRTKMRNFLTGISTVHEIIISPRTLKAIQIYSNFEPLPQFSNLSRLDVSFVESTLEFLSIFLGCCPNLQSLFMEFVFLLPVTDVIELSYVPQCFTSSLKFVQMKTPIAITEPSIKMSLASYFVRNCAVLKKLEVSKSFSNIMSKIRRIPKRCGGCEVVLLKPSNKFVCQTSSLESAMYPYLANVEVALP